MSTLKKRSRYSSESRKSFNFKSVDSELVYEYALRCAILAYMEQQTERSPSLSPTNSTKKKEERHSSLHHSLSSITERFADDSKKSDKLTKEIAKSLIKRLDDVINERDTSKVEYTDKRFRAVAEKIKKHLQQERKYRKYTSSINDIVILFLKSSEEELKKSDVNPALWYDDLNRFLAKFVDMVIQTLQQEGSARPELIEHLSNYCTTKPSLTKQQSRSSYSQPSSPSPNNSDMNRLLQFQMIVTIKNLFQISQQDLQDKLSELLPICTESAFLHDLKTCINNVHTNQSMKKQDFSTVQAYENWQKSEVKQLTELMNTLMLMNPNLTIANSSEMDVGNTNLLSRKSTDSYSSQSTTSSEQQFTFIPNEPKGYFQVLMKLCLDYDTQRISDLSESERAKTSVLSHQSNELLRECWKIWRLSSPYRAVLYLSLVKSKMDQNELELSDVFDAFRSLDKVTKENDPSLWAISEKNDLTRVFNGLNNSLLHELANSLTVYWKISPNWVQDIIELLEKIYNHPIYLETNPNPQNEILQLEEPIKGAAVERWGYIEQMTKETDEVTRLFNMADRLSKDFVSMTKKKFPQPLMGILSIPSLVMARQMPYFALEIENWTYLPDFKSTPIDEVFELYEKVLKLEHIYDKYGPETKKSLFKVESWFLPHVKRWLMRTNESTMEWVANAITQDQFQRYSEAVLHSSSVIDLFSMFTQSVEFIANLQWPNESQHCLFMTYLAKTIVQGIEDYCYRIEELIRKEVSTKLVRQNSDSSNFDIRSSITLLDRARHQFTGTRSINKEERVPPSNVITPRLCTQLNDLEAARGKLNNVYQQMHGDAIVSYLRENPLEAANNKHQERFMYTIRVVRAENLRAMDKNGLSDPYVTFEMNGQCIAKTSTVYETLNPRWDEEFDIWYSAEDVNVNVVVMDEDVITTDDECGSTWFTLSPKYAEFYQKDDLLLNLSPQGTLVLRVTVESEKNDIQFWFGKAFRTLKACENDVVGLIIDRMTPYIRHCLSRSVISKLLGRDKNSFFSAFSRSNNKQIDPDLQACEDAIAPLLDFLEYNLHILNENLTESNMQFVVLKIWNQILKCLDKALLPPLSEHLSHTKPLDDYELHIILKWLELLKILFNGGESGDAIPLEELENTEYYSILAINAAYHLDSQVLMEGYLMSDKKDHHFNTMPASRSKSVYHSRNTIKHKKPSHRKKEKNSTRLSSIIDLPQRDDILRILRMRHEDGVAMFLRNEFEKRNKMKMSPIETQKLKHVEMPMTPASLSDGLPLSPPPPLPSHGVSLVD